MEAKILTMPRPNPKQRLALTEKHRYVGYGGARGGGKSWFVRWKAVLLCLNYPGIKILITRKTYRELLNNHIAPLLSLLAGVARYNKSDKCFTFPNGSTIWFGYCANDTDLGQYQGAEFDIWFADEAGQFPEEWLITIDACVRGANDFPKRTYFTLNPGGPSHGYFKRLFIDRRFEDQEDIQLVLFVDAVSVEILSGIYQPCSTPGDGVSANIRLGSVAGGGGAGGSDIHFVILQSSTAAGNVRQLRLIGIAVRIADEAGMVQTQIVAPGAVSGFCTLFGGVVGRQTAVAAAEGIHIGCHFFQRDVTAGFVDPHRFIPLTVHQNIGVALIQIDRCSIAKEFPLCLRPICRFLGILSRHGQKSGEETVFGAMGGILITASGGIVRIKLFLRHPLIGIFGRTGVGLIGNDWLNVRLFSLAAAGRQPRQ